MVLALVLATTAVALGAVLGLASNTGGRVLWIFRALALLAALGVVFAHLLPESVEGLGLLPALLAFGLGLALPLGLERLFRSQGGPAGGKLGRELGFWGLLLHHVGDGLALGAYVLIDQQGDAGNLDVMIALLAHTVPLVAVVAAAYARAETRNAAIWRCAGLAVASMIGILATRSVDAAWVGSFELWISAAVSGLLLHVVVHDLYAPHLSAT